eukprot:1158308-Pelagomonas_calceolata.AAC.4
MPALCCALECLRASTVRAVHAAHAVCAAASTCAVALRLVQRGVPRPRLRGMAAAAVAAAHSPAGPAPGEPCCCRPIVADDMALA